MFSISGRRRPAIDMITQYPPAEPTAAERQLAVQRARVAAASKVIFERLDAQQHLWAEDRNVELIDALLDIRTALGLGPDGSEVPVVPGGPS